MLFCNWIIRKSREMYISIYDRGLICWPLNERIARSTNLWQDITFQRKWITICRKQTVHRQRTCIAINFFAASEACLPICRGSMTRTTISPLRSTASRAAAVDASWSFSTVSICLKISVLIPLTCNGTHSLRVGKGIARFYHRLRGSVKLSRWLVSMLFIHIYLNHLYQYIQMIIKKM